MLRKLRDWSALSAVSFMFEPLPKKIEHMEARFGLDFKKWIEKEMPPTGAYELKDTRGKDYLSFSALDEDQRFMGRGIQSEKGKLIRITVGTTGAPDYIWMLKENYFIVIRYPKVDVIVSLLAWEKEKEMSRRASLTSDRAIEIGKRFLS